MSGERDDGAETLFLSWVQAAPRSSEDFESLRRQHPDRADALNTLWRDWTAARHALGETEPDPSTNVPVDSPVASKERYELRDEIGRGGMGTVLRVWDTELRRESAMKVMRARETRADATESERSRFFQEAQVTGQLEHPGIVPVHELGFDVERRPYFTMSLVRGRDLSEIIDEVHAPRGEWTLARAIGVLQRVCEAMSYAHDRGVVHRDLKPSNVRVGSYGEVFVMDWGLARVDGRDDHRELRLEVGEAPAVQSERKTAKQSGSASPLVTLDGTVVGTPYYMPPEQARGEVAKVDARSDVYAVGAMLYHVVNGRGPYSDGDTSSPFAVLSRVLAGPPTPLDTGALEAPPELVAICARAMAREREKRYASMTELAGDLRAFLEGRVVRAYRTGPWVEAAAWVRRNRLLAGGLATALVVLVGSLSVANWVRQQANRELEDMNEDLVATNLELDEARNEAVARADEVLSLSASLELEQLVAEADELWPAVPERVDAFNHWIGRAEALVGELDTHRAKLDELRSSASETIAGAASNGDRRDVTWWRTELAALIAGLEALTHPETGLLGGRVSAEHGWSVPRRLAFAEELAERSISGDRARRLWADAIEAIAMTPDYGGLELTPQIGLLPLGPDPRSGLWEFAHLATGVPAERNDARRLVLAEETGVVLVLVPGGKFWMGAQSDDPGAPNYDPDTRVEEVPVHEVELSPYFLSKYEMTQAQFLETFGFNPSFYVENEFAPTLLHPVENVSWNQCFALLPRAGLSLPSEAQWERAARAGTTTPWWTGQDRESLRDAINIADKTAAEHGADWEAIRDWPDFEDGSVLHAPPGSYPANPFGFHEILGNVSEWCLDGFQQESYHAGRPKDPVVDWEGWASRAYRGGSFVRHATFTRSANRDYVAPEFANNDQGVRPARPLDE